MKNIVETAIDDGHFTTLVKAVQAAGLVDTLSGPGPFTVFAPTDAAFDKLPAGTLENVLQNKDQLTAILTYHVVSGKYMASDVKKMNPVVTIQGGSLKIEVHRLFHRGIKVDDAQVIHPDIECTNGVIHVIDSVMMPK
ncbi:MAG: fasciclin domain-containing protein [Halobacteriota archaeon]